MTTEVMAETRYIKHEFNNDEKVEIVQKMLKAEANTEAKEAEVKSFQAAAKADIAQYEAEIAGCKEKLRSGYESFPVQCVLKYLDGNVIYIKKQTGEVVETRTMTEQEQMKLAGGFTDAEQIIRADSEKIMDKDAEDE